MDIYNLIREQNIQKIKEYLINIGDDTDGRTAIHVAAEEGHLEILKLMFTVGDSCEYPQDNDGNHPLHLAAMNGHLDVVKFLVERGDVPRVSNYDGLDPCELAIISGHTDVVEFFNNGHL